jgi:molybdopterin-guanine dinucleotide biosynthesis protein A
MGTNKALLPFGGYATLIEYQYRRLAACGFFESVAISVKTPLTTFDAPLIFDDAPICAPIAAIAAVLRNARSDRVFVLAVDTPFFEGFSALIAVDSKAAIARSPSGTHPLCAVYHRSLLPRFEAAITSGEYSIKRALANEQIGYADFDERSLANLNFQADYEAALDFNAGKKADRN